jgi:arabinan endo-1,5-alpha-L-arabinosidase
MTDKSTKIQLLIFVLLWITPFVSCQCAVNVNETGRYTNPVIDENFPDPTTTRAPDGWFYVYATKTIIDGQPVNIQVARSEDLITWEHLGDALPEKPSWALQTNHFWAPHVHYDEDLKTYFLYYSAYPDNGGGKCITVATSTKPEGPFIDKGSPMLCGESFINIDPMTFDDPRTGKIFMYWGSAFQPIKVPGVDA